VDFKPSTGRNFKASITSNGIKLVENEMVSSLIKCDESCTLEFKSSLRWDYKRNEPNQKLAEPVLKTLVAFMNTEGGILLIGVDDNKKILGIENDFKDLKDWDHWQQTLVNYINDKIGKEFHEFIRIEKEEVDGKIVAKINVKPSNKPVYLNKEFYIRAGNTSLKLKDDQIEEYIQNHYNS
ncbi:MAG: ATP-binding protein, partial [Candidatus Nitrosothermus koennekii]